VDASPSEDCEGEVSDDPKDLLTPDEAAHKLGIGRTKVYELMDRGELPSLRIDRCRRIPASAIPAYIARKLEEAAHA
jgi:excisionase family DNA binding protein